MFYSHTYLGSYNRHLWCVLLLFALCMNRFSSALRYWKVITPCPKRQMERVPDICRWALGLREKTVFCLQIVFHYFNIFIIYLNSLEFPTPKCRDLLCSVYRYIPSGYTSPSCAVPGIPCLKDCEVIRWAELCERKKLTVGSCFQLKWLGHRGWSEECSGCVAG